MYIYTDKLISEIGNQLLYLIDATNKRQNEIPHGRAKAMRRGKKEDVRMQIKGYS